MNDNEPALIIKNLEKSFRLPHEQHNGIKQNIINIFKGVKGYETQHVLRDISFEITKGEFFGIVGRNGSGKSTLLKLLANIYAPNKGLIQVNGSLTPFIELGVGFNPELSGRENVFLNGALLGFSHSEMMSMYDDIVEFAELEQFMDQKLKNYSSGMQVRLAFSIAIQAKGDILLLDEVLAVGDAAFQKKCYDYFEKIKNENKTIIIVTHDMGAVRRFCTKAAYIEKGRLVKIGDPIEIANYYDEANISKVNDNKNTPKKLDSRLTVKIVDQSIDNVKISFDYNIKDGLQVYVGTSVLWNGISIAEITTSTEEPLTGSGKISYDLETKMLNGGVYQFIASLFDVKNRSLVVTSKDRNIFTIDKIDKTKGGPLRLEDNWKL